MTEMQTVLIAVNIFSFITGYLLCLYNSKDEPRNHGIPEKQQT